MTSCKHLTVNGRLYPLRVIWVLWSVSYQVKSSQSDHLKKEIQTKQQFTPFSPSQWMSLRHLDVWFRCDRCARRWKSCSQKLDRDSSKCWNLLRNSVKALIRSGWWDAHKLQGCERLLVTHLSRGNWMRPPWLPFPSSHPPARDRLDLLSPAPHPLPPNSSPQFQQFCGSRSLATFIIIHHI